MFRASARRTRNPHSWDNHEGHRSLCRRRRIQHRRHHGSQRVRMGAEMSDKITIERESLKRWADKLSEFVHHGKADGWWDALNEMYSALEAQPVEMSNEDAFTVWVEEESADFQTLELVAVIDRLKREAVAMQEWGAREIEEAYNTIDRYLRNNLGDSDYAEVSKALEILYAAPPATAAVPLTDEYLIELFREVFLTHTDPMGKDNMTIAFARAVLAAAGGKP